MRVASATTRAPVHAQASTPFPANRQIFVTTTYDPTRQSLGNSVHVDDIVDALEFLDDWEARYSYIIDLGKQLPAMPAALRTEANIVRGCQSQVWLDTRFDEITGKMWLGIDSDALIVKGLAAIVLAAYNGKTPAQILALDIENLFSRLDLIRHLSLTRGNGLRAMVKRIQESARTHVPEGAA